MTCGLCISSCFEISTRILRTCSLFTSDLHSNLSKKSLNSSSSGSSLLKMSSIWSSSNWERCFLNEVRYKSLVTDPKRQKRMNAFERKTRKYFTDCIPFHKNAANCLPFFNEMVVTNEGNSFSFSFTNCHGIGNFIPKQAIHFTCNTNTCTFFLQTPFMYYLKYYLAIQNTGLFKMFNKIFSYLHTANFENLWLRLIRWWQVWDIICWSSCSAVVSSLTSPRWVSRRCFSTACWNSFKGCASVSCVAVCNCVLASFITDCWYSTFCAHIMHDSPSRKV